MISRQSLIVARWEFLRFFKWKQQLISYLLMMTIMIAVVVWGYMTDESRTQYRIAVPEHYVLNGTEQFEFLRPAVPIEQQLAQLQDEDSWHAVITEDEQGVTVHIRSASKWQAPLEALLINYFREQYAEQLGLSSEQLNKLQQPVTIRVDYQDEQFRGKDTPEKMIAIAVLILLFIGLSTIFGQILLSITGEKQQRVTEQLYSIITPQQWMDGKVLGNALSALKAMFTSSVVMLLMYGIALLVFGDGAVDLSWLNLGVLAWLVPFTILGLLLSASFMGAIAASIDDPNTSGKGVVMMITWLPMVFTFMVIDSPSGTGMAILSFLPLTSFAAMPVKMAMVDVSWWQPVLSLLLLALTTYWMRIVAGRIFLRGMQLYGKEPGWGEIIRWAVSRRTD